MSSSEETALQVRFVRHPRARRLRLKVDLVSGQVVLTAPRFASQAQAVAFLKANQDWVSRQRQRLLPPRPFVCGSRITLFGDPLLLKHDPLQKGTSLTMGVLSAGGSDSRAFARRVAVCVRQQAQQRFSVWVLEFAASLGVDPPHFVLRDTRTRWGSCSSKSGLSLSWRLAFAPPEVARYVVAHEMAHLREMNHSPRFWALVNQLVGRVSSHRQWLAEHGYSLMGIGVATLPPQA